MSFNKFFLATSQVSSYPNIKHTAFNTIITKLGGLTYDLITPNYVLSIVAIKFLASFNIGIIFSNSNFDFYYMLSKLDLSFYTYFSIY